MEPSYFSRRPFCCGFCCSILTRRKFEMSSLLDHQHARSALVANVVIISGDDIICIINSVAVWAILIKIPSAGSRCIKLINNDLWAVASKKRLFRNGCWSLHGFQVKWKYSVTANCCHGLVVNDKLVYYPDVDRNCNMSTWNADFRWVNGFHFFTGVS